LTTLPDIVIHECTPLFSEWALHFVLKDRYTIESRVFDSLDLGLPSRRRRRYTICRLNGRTRVTTPYAIGPGSLFEQVAFRNVELSGDAYCQVDSKDWRRFCVDRALSLGQPCAHCDAPEREFSLMTAARRSMAQKYIGVYLSEPKYHKSTVADISQDPMSSYRVLCRYVPTLQRSSFIFSLLHKRCFHPLEYFAALSVPVFSDRYTCPIMDAVRELSLQQVQELTGNAMNLAQIGSVITYALATTEKL
jgi:site-specific DNA-cytosine methylase